MRQHGHARIRYQKISQEELDKFPADAEQIRPWFRILGAFTDPEMTSAAEAFLDHVRSHGVWVGIWSAALNGSQEPIAMVHRRSRGLDKLAEAGYLTAERIEGKLFYFPTDKFVRLATGTPLIS
jgi:hypothetical protein